MRVLQLEEIEQVSGAAEFTFSLGPVEVKVTSGEIAGLYESAVSSMTDFFMWWDPEELLCTGS